MQNWSLAIPQVSQFSVTFHPPCIYRVPTLKDKELLQRQRHAKGLPALHFLPRVTQSQWPWRNHDPWLMKLILSRSTKPSTYQKYTRLEENLVSSFPITNLQNECSVQQPHSPSWDNKIRGALTSACIYFDSSSLITERCSKRRHYQADSSRFMPYIKKSGQVGYTHLASAFFILHTLICIL
jgi:hypothetical protein